MAPLATSFGSVLLCCTLAAGVTAWQFWTLAWEGVCKASSRSLYDAVGLGQALPVTRQPVMCFEDQKKLPQALM